MAITDAFILLVPAMLLLLAVGALASHIERAGYMLHGGDAVPTLEGGRSAHDVMQLYNQRNRELSEYRRQSQELENQLSDLQRERANLLGQEQTLADQSANMVSEAGYPALGVQGFYAKLEGPAKVMPFAGISSVATAMGGKRQVRIVIWGLGPVEAQNFVLSWGGEDSRLLQIRPFDGTLMWHEA